VLNVAYWDKFSSGLNVAPVLLLAQCQIFVSYYHFASFLPLFRLIRDQNRCRRHFCTVQLHESAKKEAKRCNKSEKKQMFGTGLNLALVLHLVQSLIYPGATFSTVPAKCYECPSICTLYYHYQLL